MAGETLSLSVLERPMVEPATQSTPVDRVRQTLTGLQEPAPLNYLRKLCGMRTAAVCSAFAHGARQVAFVSSGGFERSHALPSLCFLWRLA